MCVSSMQLLATRGTREFQCVYCIVLDGQQSQSIFDFNL